MFMEPQRKKLFPCLRKVTGGVRVTVLDLDPQPGKVRRKKFVSCFRKVTGGIVKVFSSLSAAESGGGSLTG